MHPLISILTHITDAVFPQRCRACGESGALLCAKCLNGIPKAEQPRDLFISAVFDYRNPHMRKVIWQFKYKNARSVAKHFGEKLYEEIIGDLGDCLHFSRKETFLLVPIPLHKKRLLERGYNQSELLAREIIKYDTEKIFELTTKVLVRTRITKSQAKSEKRITRFENLRGAFVALPELVHNKHVLLVDDVTTTGATLSEARKALLEAGAKTVRAYAVAH